MHVTLSLILCVYARIFVSCLYIFELALSTNTTPHPRHHILFLNRRCLFSNSRARRCGTFVWHWLDKNYNGKMRVVFFFYFFLFEVIGFYFVAHMMENIYVAPVVLFTPRVKQITNIAQVIKVYSTQ